MFFLTFTGLIANPSGNVENEKLASFFDDFSTRNYFIVSNSPASVYSEEK